MPSPFHNSVFYEIVKNSNRDVTAGFQILGGIDGSHFEDTDSIYNIPIVVFDFETTGTNAVQDRVTEVGAIKFINKKEVGRFEALVNPTVKLTEEITKITGLTDDDLQDKPTFEDIAGELHNFLRGCFLIAHNAEFDLAFLAYESRRLGIACTCKGMCTLKMARELLPQLERKNLDFLANHYNLKFEARHRSIGDVLVTKEVLFKMLEENPSLNSLKSLSAYFEETPKLF